MNARVQSCHGDGCMKRGRGGDAQHIKQFMINEIPPLGVSVLIGDAVRRTKLLQRISLHTGQCYKINIGCLGVPRQVLLSGPTEADHSSMEPVWMAHARTPSPMRRPLKRGAGWLTTAGSAKSVPCSGCAHSTAFASMRLMFGWW